MSIWRNVVLMLCLAAGAATAQSRIDSQPPPADLGQTWVEVDGEVYGARADELGPIGGGEGYQRIVTDGDYCVTTVDELIEALKQAQAGQVVYVEPDADIDCTTLVFAEKLVLEIPEGVTLASNRGPEGSRGAVIYSYAFATRPLIRTLGPNVRITGLWIRGPDPKRRLDHHERSFKAERGDREAQHEYYYKFPVSEGIDTQFSGLEVDNCEVSGWSHAGVHLGNGRDHHIHHCYIHHNQMNGLGYGVSHGYGEEAVSLIEYNLFDYNRHSIAGTGKPGNAYEACNNVELGVSLSHNFDMHGGGDRRDGTSIAGDWIKIHHNTFRGTGVPAIAIRGVPVEQAELHNNWLYHSGPAGHVFRPWPTGGDTHVECQNNAYGREQPLVWDAEYQAGQYQKALEAGIAMYQAGNYTYARLHLAQALTLAADAAERAKAQFQIAHCYLKQGLIGVARTQYQVVLDTRAAPLDDRLAARRCIKEIEQMPPAEATREWTLVFSDDFERDDLGENWRVLHGEWRIEGGKLVCSSGHSEVVINQPFPGCQRIEFDAMTRAERPCDFSPVIHSGGKGSRGFEGGYLLQFGGAGNTLNRILRSNEPLEDRSADRFIEPREVHHVVAELDGDTVRLTVNGSTIVEGHDDAPLLDEGHEIAGLYMYAETMVDNLRLYTSAPD